jgi:hypothetical protein
MKFYFYKCQDGVVLVAAMLICGCLSAAQAQVDNMPREIKVLQKNSLSGRGVNVAAAEIGVEATA